MNDQNNSTAVGVMLAVIVILVLLVVAGAGVTTFYVRSTALTQQVAAERAMAEARMQAELAQLQQEEVLRIREQQSGSEQDATKELETLRNENRFLQLKLLEAEQRAKAAEEQSIRPNEQMSRELDSLRIQVETLKQEIRELKSKAGDGDQLTKLVRTSGFPT